MTGLVDQDAPALRGRARWAVPALIALAGAPNFLGYLLPRPVLPAIQAALATGPGDEVRVKLVMTAFAAGLIFGSPAAGLALERTGYRTVLVSAVLLFMVAGAAGVVVSNLDLLIATRFVTGIAAAALNIAAVTMAGDLFGGVRRARWVGMIAAAGSLSTILSSPIAGWVGTISWRLPFLLHLLALPILVLALLIGPIDRPRAARAGAGPGQPFPRAILALSLIVGVLLTLPSIYVAFRMRDVGLASPATIGLFFLACNIPEAIAGALFGNIRRALSTRSVFVAGFAAMAAGLATVALSGAAAGILAGLALYGLGNSLANANTMTLATSVETRRSRVVGLVLGSYCVASIAGVALLEAVFHHGRADAPLLALAALAGAAALFHGLATYRPGRRPASAAA